METFFERIGIYSLIDKAYDNVLDSEMIAAPQVLEMLRKNANIYTYIRPHLKSNNGGTLKDGTAYSLSGTFYFEIAIYNDSRLMKLIFSNDVSEEKFNSYDDAEAAVVMYLISNWDELRDKIQIVCDDQE